MSDTRKLTKKQKKALAFRERSKQDKGKSKDGDDGGLDNDIPIEENQDLAEIQMAKMEAEGVRQKDSDSSQRSKGDQKGKTGRQEVHTKVQKSKKRKHEEPEALAGGGEQAASSKPRKRAKKSTGDDGSGTETTEVDKSNQPPLKQRFILFVGNLRYTTTIESIQNHFSACEPPPTIRLLTPKATPGKSTTKSKGCAFLEFSQKSGLQQALKLHQSELDGRRINVELTAGGGGKSEQRLSKLRERNKELNQQREKRQEKSKGTGRTEPMALNPQRYSSTSGTEQKPLTKRTWTVGGTVDEETHRGGKKHSRTRKSKSKNLGTGVNAIPVG